VTARGKIASRIRRGGVPLGEIEKYQSAQPRVRRGAGRSFRGDILALKTREMEDSDTGKESMSKEKRRRGVLEVRRIFCHFQADIRGKKLGAAERLTTPGERR